MRSRSDSAHSGRSKSQRFGVLGGRARARTKVELYSAADSDDGQACKELGYGLDKMAEMLRPGGRLDPELVALVMRKTNCADEGLIRRMLDAQAGLPPPLRAHRTRRRVSLLPRPCPCAGGRALAVVRFADTALCVEGRGRGGAAARSGRSCCGAWRR